MKIDLNKKLTVEEIREAILYLKEEYGITYKSWTERVVISEKTISRLMTGRIKSMSDENRTNLGRAIQKVYRKLNNK